MPGTTRGSGYPGMRSSRRRRHTTGDWCHPGPTPCDDIHVMDDPVGHGSPAVGVPRAPVARPPRVVRTLGRVALPHVPVEALRNGLRRVVGIAVCHASGGVVDDYLRDGADPAALDQLFHGFLKMRATALHRAHLYRPGGVFLHRGEHIHGALHGVRKGLLGVNVLSRVESLNQNRAYANDPGWPPGPRRYPCAPAPAGNRRRFGSWGRCPWQTPRGAPYPHRRRPRYRRLGTVGRHAHGGPARPVPDDPHRDPVVGPQHGARNSRRHRGGGLQESSPVLIHDKLHPFTCRTRPGIATRPLNRLDLGMHPGVAIRPAQQPIGFFVADDLRPSARPRPASGRAASRRSPGCSTTWKCSPPRYRPPAFRASPCSPADPSCGRGWPAPRVAPAAPRCGLRDTGPTRR